MKPPALNPDAAPYQGRAALDAEVARRAAISKAEPVEIQAEPLPDVPNAGAGAAEAMAALLARFQPMTPERARKHRFDTMIAPRLKVIGFRERYQIDLLAWNCPPQEKVFRFCQQRFTQVGAIVALVGERGVGKTLLASQLCRDRIDAWLAYYEVDAAARPAAPPLDMGRYVKLVDLLAKFKAIYADFGSIDTDRLMAEREALCEESLLIVDELHECHDQKMKGRVLTDILDRRYSNRLDTLLISNETDAAFRESIGDSALSRISEHGKIIPCAWKSFRDQ